MQWQSHTEWKKGKVQTSEVFNRRTTVAHMNPTNSQLIPHASTLHPSRAATLKWAENKKATFVKNIACALTFCDEPKDCIVAWLLLDEEILEIPSRRLQAIWREPKYSAYQHPEIFSICEEDMVRSIVEVSAPGRWDELKIFWFIQPYLHNQLSFYIHCGVWSESNRKQTVVRLLNFNLDISGTPVSNTYLTLPLLSLMGDNEQTCARNSALGN